MDLNEHILRKELINMREEQKSDWRKDIKDLATGGDHPYVDVMPDSDQPAQMAKNKVKDNKKEKEDKQEVKEGNAFTDFFTGDSPERLSLVHI